MKHLFLDLEDTIITPVIDGWHNVELVNIDKIKKTIDMFKPDFVDIFSFAIHNQFEFEQFNKTIRPFIEQELNVKLNMVPTVDVHIKNACCEILKIHPDKIDFDDMSTFWSKQESFRLFCRHQFRKNNFALTNQLTEVLFLDDAVEHEDFMWPMLNIKGRIRNIDLI